MYTYIYVYVCKHTYIYNSIVAFPSNRRFLTTFQGPSSALGIHATSPSPADVHVPVSLPSPATVASSPLSKGLPQPLESYATSPSPADVHIHVNLYVAFLGITYMLPSWAYPLAFVSLLCHLGLVCSSQNPSAFSAHLTRLSLELCVHNSLCDM